MMKNEKLRDFKTQERKIQAVWNTRIYNIEIVTCQANMGQQRASDDCFPWIAVDVFISCVLHISYSLSCGT